MEEIISKGDSTDKNDEIFDSITSIDKLSDTDHNAEEGNALAEKLSDTDPNAEGGIVSTDKLKDINPNVEEVIVRAEKLNDTDPNAEEGIARAEKFNDSDPNAEEGIVRAEKFNDSDSNAEEGIVRAEKFNDSDPNAEEGIISAEKLSDTDPNAEKGIISAEKLSDTDHNAEEGIALAEILSDTDPNAEEGIVSAEKLSDTDPNVEKGIISAQKISYTDPNVEEGIISAEKLKDINPNAEGGIISAEKISDTYPNAEEGIVSAEKISYTDPNVEEGIISAEKLKDINPNAEGGIISAEKISDTDPNAEEGIVSAEKLSDTDHNAEEGIVSAEKISYTDPNVEEGIISAEKLKDINPNAEGGIISAEKISDTDPNAEEGIVSAEKLSDTDPNAEKGIISAEKLSGTDHNAEEGIVSAEKLSDTDPNAEEGIVSAEILSDTDPNVEEGIISAEKLKDINPNAEGGIISAEKIRDTDPNAEDNDESVLISTMSDLLIDPSIPNEDLELSVDGASEFVDVYVDHKTQESSLKTSLSALGLKQDQVEFLIEQGEKYLEKALLLSKKLKVSKETANQAIDVLKSLKKVEELILTPADVKTIQECLKENPDIDCHEDIALLCEIDEELVSKYFEMLPLNEKQQKFIQERYNKDISVSDISNLLKISTKKIQDYIEKTFMTFSGKEGRFVFDIINRHCGQMSISTLREKIKNENLKLQDQLYRILNRKNESENNILRAYFRKYKESEDILNFDLNLTIDEILTIKQSGNDSAEQLSVKLNKIESVINSYIYRYYVHPVELKHQREFQEKQISELTNAYGINSFSFENYRTIITIPFDEIIKRVQTKSKNSQDMLIKLLPLVFYYLKCSLPFEDIARIIANVSEIILTTHDVFHLVFQLSDPVLRGLCIEHYSFSNPVPLYYPKLKLPRRKSCKVEFEICKELWYCLEQYNGLISFGLGRASWNTVGKSTLLDLIFETDFVKGNPQSSAFHSGSIDIQITKNLFGEANKSHLESTKWAYIDCHSYSNLKVIQVLCSHLDLALIHVCYNDYKNNKQEINKELTQIEKVKHIYLFVRDYEGDSMQVSVIGKSLTQILIPNLTRKDIKYHSVIKSLKEVGYKILHLKIEQPTLIRSQLIEDIMLDLDHDIVKVIQADKQLIKNTTDYFVDTNKIDFSFLSYYPTFVDYMSSYHKASYETDQDRIDELNAVCEELSGRLSNISRGNIVLCFNKILQQDNSTLILWKLSRELLHLSKASTFSKQEETSTNTVKEQKNDKYTLEILWRESLLSQRYGQNTEDKSREKYKQLLTANFSKHVGSGEAFELIDGDNLRFFNKDIDSLLRNFYSKQEESLKMINKNKTMRIKPAPIVVSIFGPQSSGKSTLLNYCFGCKFLTSAGRCTRGIYASLSKLDRPVNLSQSFLILDTEGLDAIERDNIKDTSMIHFDRTMVLFCLSVSQAVIINVKGDIGSEMQNLLQICAYSLNRLKVSKVKAPKIFFVLNQQADPDPNKHLDAINLLMEKLNSESGLMENGVKISDLIQVSRENLFILPSAFNSQQMNKPDAKLFNSNVTKLSPTIAFSDKCTNLRLAIIDQLDHMSVNDRAPFQNMSEWLGMAGVIWDTIIKYQDIVKYRNLEELMCSNKLGGIATKLMKNYIYSHEEEFTEKVQTICTEISAIETSTDPNTILAEAMFKFDEVFVKYQEVCFREFSIICRNDTLLKKIQHICNETSSNIRRLIYVVRKQHEDEIKVQINSVLTEIHISESMDHFQKAISENVDKYLKLSLPQQVTEFEDIWNKTFGIEDQEEELRECQANFSDLYSLFGIESSTMETKQTIHSMFCNLKFDMNSFIKYIKGELLYRFHNPFKLDQSERLVYPLTEYHFPIKEMIPYNGRLKYDYLCQDSLYKIERTLLSLYFKEALNPLKWIPKDCHGLIRYCSGLENHPDVIWKPNYKTQVTTLTSVLRNPDDMKISTWEKFINDISTDVITLLETNPDVTHAVVKQIIHALYFRIRLLNYEIGYIIAGLNNTAERTLSILVFAYAFKYLWEKKLTKRRENQSKKDSKKRDLLQYFFQKIENRKMARGTWNRDTMAKSDEKISRKYALDFIESVKRGLKTSELQNIKKYLGDRKELFSHDSIVFIADEKIANYLKENPGVEVTDATHFVVQFTCNRNEVLKELFLGIWREEEEKLYEIISRNVRIAFKEKLSILIDVLSELLKKLIKMSTDNKILLGDDSKTEEELVKKFDSDNNFELIRMDIDDHSIGKEIPFKAMVNCLKKYLDPTVTPDEFNKYFSGVLTIDGLDVQVCKINILCCKSTESILDADTFRRLVSTKMFNDGELIFNIKNFIRHFQSDLKEYCIQLEKNEFQEMIASLKSDFETKMIGCPSQCPSCGKFCEREIHTNEGKCQIKTGHQISSMGGKVWNADEDHTAVLFMCDVYQDHTQIYLPSGATKWGEFKDRCGKEWNWYLPDDEKYRSKQLSNQKLMKDIWNKFGQGILNYYYDKEKTRIKFVPYTTYEEVNHSLFSAKYLICFVIDGTGSMHREIERARVSVGQLIQHFKEKGSSSEFRIVIYRDHCDDTLIETFPQGNEFTPQQNTVTEFLDHVEADGGGDFPEAVLDGLATAATQSDWKCTPGVRNKIIHIFDAPPHGDFPNYKSHLSHSNKANCCCCNHDKCKFDWDKDVWTVFKKYNIEYHGINTCVSESTCCGDESDLSSIIMKMILKSQGLDTIFSNYESKMKEELGDLCADFQVVGKELVNDAIVQIFIDHKT